ncbi:MAG: PQQ-dependent sugar dehydrogenase [Bryobacterales bacterium]|nr:PQQ-dependent sugar dehydrogenase [Bryobacterales bacterium]
MGFRFALAGFLVGLPLLAQPQIRLTQVTGGLNGASDIQNARDGSGRLFLAQQNGLIRIFRNGALLSTPFLNISSKTEGGGERGLLGLAFSPTFTNSRRFYVYYTALNGDIVISMFRASASNPDVAENTEQILLTIPHPRTNHNGGSLRFGPDGYLYAATGDGGGGGDPDQAGQNLQTLLGKILRLDVESQPGTALIPSTNPFANSATAKREIWAYGLRNPWRTSFDRQTGEFWIADVGQNAREEVNFQSANSPGGQNYGWNLTEGTLCFATTPCNTQGITMPVTEYANPALGCSVTGGYVYRGTQYPSLAGTYFYADFCSGRVWGITRQGGTFTNQFLLSSGLNITTFGEDEGGEIYAASGGSLFHLEAEAAATNVTVEITSNPSGQRFQVDAGATVLTAPQTLTFPSGSTHSIRWLNTDTPSGRQVFSAWADGPTANPREITATAGASYQGVFQLAYPVTTQSNGSGSIVLDPSRTDTYYASGTTVRATAIPGAGYRFAGFSGCFTSPGLSTTFAVSQACTVTALFLPEEVPPPTGLSFVPVAPCRVMDTRDPARSGSYGPPTLAAGAARVVRLAQTCGLPTAAAYSLNITVVPRGTLGFLTIYPSDRDRPLASTLNSPAGQIIANAALVRSSPNGEVSIYVTDAADVILDVNGYFVP